MATAPSATTSSEPPPPVRTKTLTSRTTPSFISSFWTPDYASGLNILFSKLNQGVAENNQILTIASMRADAEEQYAERLGDIAPAIDRENVKGFGRDDGGSVRKAYEGVRSEMVEATKNHQKIANNIRELVVNPFGRWCEAHAQRVQNSQDDLNGKIRAHERQAEAVRKLRASYFNKCRLVEDAEEEGKFAFQDPEKKTASPTLEEKGKGKDTGSPHGPPPTIVVQEESEMEDIEIGDKLYSPDMVKSLLTKMLNTIRLGNTKVAIIGTYANTSSGSDITDFIQQEMGASNVGYAEQIGQDLVDRGFLRLIGNVGSTFANSSKMKYQWRPRVFQITGIPDKSKPLGRTSTAGSIAADNDSVLSSPVVGNLTETLQAWNPLNNPYANLPPAERLKRESEDADQRYKDGVRKQDLLRCELEETIMTHLKFLERCETDRLKAIRSVILDFSGAISNSIPSFQSQVDHMMLYQETINPLGDLRYLLENYKTGPFVPKPTPYENYYGSVGNEIFGVDLEARAKADKKRVPLIVTTILVFLDHRYPELDGDAARRHIWLEDVPLAAQHHLRNAINADPSALSEALLARYEMPIVAAVLKLYLLELPDSLVSSQVYDIVKTIYDTTPDAASDSADADPSAETSPRIKVLQSTLGQLRLNNIATLDALTTHFTRLIDLTSADNDYVNALSQTMAPCILRPRLINTLTMDEKHSVKLVRDLLDHKEAIFGYLKRQASQSANQSLGANGTSDLRTATANRQRAISSTDEASRRAAMQERARAINNASHARAKSPAPINRHRRDKSTDGSLGTGRFPVVASPRPGSDGNSHARAVSSVKRGSLEVPSAHSSPVVDRNSDLTSTGSTSSSNRDLNPTPPKVNLMSRFTQENNTPPQDSKDTAYITNISRTNGAPSASIIPQHPPTDTTPITTTSNTLTDAPHLESNLPPQPSEPSSNSTSFASRAGQRPVSGMFATAGPGPHIPLSMNDDDDDEDDTKQLPSNPYMATNTNPYTSATTQPPTSIPPSTTRSIPQPSTIASQIQSQDESSSTTVSPANSIKRQSAIHAHDRNVSGGLSGLARKPPSGRYGSLQQKSQLELGGGAAHVAPAKENAPPAGVTLSDGAMDDDFA